MEPDLNNIKKIYDNLNYSDQYGGSIILFIIITIVVILLMSYFHTMINLQPIIDDWPNQRCKPTIIPFAGLITHPEGVTASEYTATNFVYCTQNILTNITGFSVQPLTFVTNSLQDLASKIQYSIQSSRGMFDKVRTSLQSVSEEIMGRLMHIMIPLMRLIISFKDVVGKIQATMTASLYTLLGGYYTFKSLMETIAKFIINILITLAIVIAMFWALPITSGAAVANTSIFVALSIPMAVILSFMANVLKINDDYKIPQLKCFDKDTLLIMNDGSLKKIIDIEVGDILSGSNAVTAKMKVTTEGSIMYNLNNVIVSDSHMVRYKNKWIPVHKHPSARQVGCYNEEFLYCLNTTHKIIKINDTIFTDWDEIYDENLNKVLNNDVIPLVNTELIHKFLDCGFVKSTKVAIENDSYLDINKIKINDILANGEKVYGIVEIDGSNVAKQFKYNLGENYVEGYIPDLTIKKENISISNNKLYHLLTDKGTFKIENLIIKDYNAAIDRFLEI